MPHMQDDFPLLMSRLYDHAVRIFPDAEIIWVEGDGGRRRITYAEDDGRIRRLAAALDQLGVGRGEAVGTFAWNSLRHHELYWATANSGRVCHTLNIRLFAEQLVYIINHAGDKVLFVDPDLVEVVAALMERLRTVEHVVVLSDQESDLIPGSLAYEDLISAHDPVAEWPELDEKSPIMLCYTSGTTGDPKGVAYTQRSTYLHTISNLALFPIDPRDNVMPVVPMFHAAAWGYPFMAFARGATITYPGPAPDAERLVNLISEERVTFSAGVPTVWSDVRQYLMAHPEVDTSSLRTFLCGGAATPSALIDWFWKERGILVTPGWGMTETNPVAAVATLKPKMDEWDWESKLRTLDAAGLPVPGLEVRIVDEDGKDLPWDNEAFGELLIRGPWIAAEYYRDDRRDSFEDGWLRTGDICKVTPEGYIRITDRAKDLIKSGGEWISSLELEKELMAHPDVLEAAVIGVADPRWGERPLAHVVLRGGTVADEGALRQHLQGRVASWWVPERIVFVASIPKTGTGKFDKKLLRQLDHPGDRDGM